MQSVISNVAISIRRHRHYFGRGHKILNKSSQSESGEEKMYLRYIWGKKNELKSEREFDQCKDPEPVQMIPHESQNHYIPFVKKPEKIGFHKISLEMTRPQ